MENTRMCFVFRVVGYSTFSFVFRSRQRACTHESFQDLTCGLFVLSDRFGHFQVVRHDGLNRSNKILEL